MWKVRLCCLLIIIIVILTNSDAFNSYNNNFDDIEINKNELLLDKLILALENVLNYLKNKESVINIDCLFGISFSNVFLGDSVIYANNTSSAYYKTELLRLYQESQAFYQTVLPKMRNTKHWIFAQYITSPTLWRKSVKYRNNSLTIYEIGENDINNPFENNIEENISDFCLYNLINLTISLNPQTCYLNEHCQLYFVEKMFDGTKYILTHKLLLFQLAKLRKCQISASYYNMTVNKMCSKIYSEIIYTDKLSSIANQMDLFMEQSILCGYEGFAEFFKTEWIEFIITAQLDSGCYSDTYPAYGQYKHSKKNANYWPDGCMDHTTGLSCAILSMYINYLLKL